MGVPKPLQKTLVRKMVGHGSKSMDELAVASKASDDLRFSQMEQETLKEFQTTQAQLDADVFDIRKEIDEAVNAEMELERRTAVVSPKAEPTTFHQARDAEEFAERYREQMFDPVYSSKASVGRLDAVIVSDVEEARAVHLEQVAATRQNLNKIPRWEQRTKAWSEGGPYADDIQYHTDRIGDPTRPDGFIQFEDPREIGIHMGYNAQAESIIKPDIESVLKEQADFEAALNLMARVLKIDPIEIQRRFARATNDFYLQKFRKETNPNIWDDVEQIIDRFTDKINANPQAASFINEMKEMQVPNTTPLLFRGKNGILLRDEGSFYLETVRAQVEDIFPDDVMEIAAAVSKGSRAERTKGLTNFLESKGYDHAYYYNRVEGKGGVSIINWNPDLQASPWDARFSRDNPAIQARAATTYVLGVLGVGLGAASRSDK